MSRKVSIDLDKEDEPRREEKEESHEDGDYISYDDFI